jgi:hypothetical protein
MLCDRGSRVTSDDGDRRHDTQTRGRIDSPTRLVHKTRGGSGRHSYFGSWFKTTDRSVRDIEFRATLGGFAASPLSSAVGPVEQFSVPLGFDDAAAGGTFVKIGVGVLRKADLSPYAWTTPYEVVDPGVWTVRRRRDSVEFTQRVVGPSGYAYLYRKVVRLSPGKEELVLEHRLENLGTRTIDTPAFAHNFLVMDGQPTGPDFVIRVPFQIQDVKDRLGVMQVRGDTVTFERELVDDEWAMVEIAGFGNEAKDYDIRVENQRTGRGVRISGDRPLARLSVWAIRPTRCPEPFINVHVEPGQEFTWRITYAFYSIAPHARTTK